MTEFVRDMQRYFTKVVRMRVDASRYVQVNSLRRLQTPGLLTNMACDLKFEQLASGCNRGFDAMHCPSTPGVLCFSAVPPPPCPCRPQIHEPGILRSGVGAQASAEAAAVMMKPARACDGGSSGLIAWQD